MQRVFESNKSCQLWFNIGFLLPQGRRNAAIGIAIGSPARKEAVVSYMTICDYLSYFPLNNRWREACCLSLCVSCWVCVTLGQELFAAWMDKNKNKSVPRLWCRHPEGIAEAKMDREAWLVPQMGILRPFRELWICEEMFKFPLNALICGPVKTFARLVLSDFSLWGFVCLFSPFLLLN